MDNKDVERIRDGHRAVNEMWRTVVGDFIDSANKSTRVYWQEVFNGKPIGRKGILVEADHGTGSISIKQLPIGMIRVWTVNEFFAMMIGRQDYLSIERGEPK